MTETTHRVWIFANGEIPDLERLRDMIQPDDRLIAADGGYHAMVKLGLTPERVIGDLDSLLPEEIERLTQMGVPLERYPVDKDETDLELAINRALSFNFQELRIAGALGGRLDQTLGNLFLLAQPNLAGKDVKLEDGTEQVFLIRDTAEIIGRVGDTVSLLPLGGPAQGVVTEGLKFPLKSEGLPLKSEGFPLKSEGFPLGNEVIRLHGETLVPERTRGISNVLLAERGTVRLSKGILICILRRA